jgi:uncharacterized membrane protein YqjE
MNSGPDPEASSGPSLRESAVDFVAARMELLALEAREAGKEAARRGAMAGLAAGLACVAWLAAAAGITGWVAASGKIPWHFAALGMAAVHLLAAGALGLALRRPAPPAFPLSKAELTKDRAWLLNLKDTPKS